MYVKEQNNIKFVIFPSENVRSLYFRAMKNRKVKWNRATAYKDVNGYGAVFYVDRTLPGGAAYIKY